MIKTIMKNITIFKIILSLIFTLLAAYCMLPKINIVSPLIDFIIFGIITLILAIYTMGLLIAHWLETTKIK